MDPAELIAVLERFFSADPAEKSRILERHPDLLSDEVAARLEDLGRFARDSGDAEVAFLLSEIGTALGEIRNAGSSTPRPGEPVEDEATDELGAIVGKAVRLVGRYQRHGSLADLEKACEVWEQLLAHPAFERSDPETRLNALNDAAVTRMAMYRATGDLQHLDAALECLQGAVRETPPGAAGLPDRLSNLGAMLSSRYDHTSEVRDLERAVALYHRALEGSPREGPNVGVYLNSLGVALLKLYRRSGNLGDLERCLKTLEEALARASKRARVTGVGADPSLAHGNLGSALREKFARTGEVSHLERACDHLERGLRLLPPTAPERALLLDNLGNALKELFDETGRLDHLNRAIEILESTVTSSGPEFHLYPRQIGGLAVALGARYQHAKEPEDLERAIALIEQAEGMIDGESPSKAEHSLHRGGILALQHERTGSPAHYREALEAYREAARLGQSTSIEIALRGARNWADLAFLEADWSEAAKGYSGVQELSRRLLAVNLARGQREQWLGELQNLGDREAYALARTGDLEGALVAADRNHARLLEIALEAERRSLTKLSRSGHAERVQLFGESADRWFELATPVTTQPGGLEDLEPGAALRGAAEGVDRALARIRQVPGFERFVLPSDLGLIRRARGTEPLVYLALTRAGGLALILDPDDQVTPVWLPELTYEEVVAQLFGGEGDDVDPRSYLTAYMLWRKRPRDAEAGERWRRALAHLTSWLWRVLVGPLLESVGAASELVIVPSGALGMLPIHAAWTEDAESPTGRLYALDKLVLSCAPSARSLLASREIARRVEKPTLLAVGDPRPTEASRLVHATVEAEAAASTFEAGSILRHEQASKAAVMSAIPAHSVLHFACHGLADLIHPLNSGLIMAHSEVLTLADVLDADTADHRLAVLSACETAIPGIRLPDEVIGLPSGFLGAGAAGVVGSLWTVPDLSTAMLMARFYDSWRNDGLSPRVALRDAQVWIRDSTNGEKERYFAALALKSGGIPLEAVQAAIGGESPTERSFSDPYHWAAFQYVGV